MHRINNFLDFLLFLISLKLNFFLIKLGNLENIIFEKNSKEIKKPIFICGLARSGTTALLNILNDHNSTASFEYKDLPFIKTLYFWNLINKFYYKGIKSKPRLHGDGLGVSPDSPDAIEELIWGDFIEDYQNSGFFKFLSENYKDKKFEELYIKQIKKILKIRGNKERYLSKGNYNIFRLKYIKKIFPDAKIIICFRDPIETAISSIKVHKNFLHLSEKNNYFDKILKYMCHFEFGKFRKSFANDKDDLEISLLQENEYYYIKQWYKVYSLAIKEYQSLPNTIFINNQTMIKNSNFIKILLKKLELSDNLNFNSVFEKKSINNDHNLNEFVNLKNLYNQLNLLEKKTLFSHE